VKKDHPASKTI